MEIGHARLKTSTVSYRYRAAHRLNRLSWPAMSTPAKHGRPINQALVQNRRRELGPNWEVFRK